jgi:photosystem II stability/assembly factor-like uncharacterized protein
MKKIFTLCLVSFCLISSWAQSPKDGYLHIQSLTPGFHDFINDSVFVSLKNKNNLTYLSHTNINTMKWEHKAVFPNNQLLPNMIVMKNEMEGVTFSGGLKYTKDGGKSFTNATITLTSVGQTPLNLYKTSSGYLAVYRLNNSNFPLYYSADGISWANVRDGGTFSTPSFVGDTIYYLNSFAISISPNAGQSFPNANFINPQNLPAQFTFFHAASHRVFIGGNANNVYVTSNGGATWTPITFSPAAFSFVGAVFKKEMEGIIYQGVNGNFYYTTDGGASWTPANKPAGTQQNPNFSFVGDKLFNGGRYTTNWGETWKNITEAVSGSPIHDISFHNKLGIYVGNDGTYGVTTNGGYHFSTPTGPLTSLRITACAAINDSLLLAGDFRGEVYRSANKGQNWNKVFTNGSNNTLQSFRWTKDGKVIGIRNFTTTPVISTNFGASFQTISVTGNFADFNTSGTLFSVRKSGTDIKVYRHNTPYNSANTSEIAVFPVGTFEIYNFKMANDNVGYIFGQEAGEKLVTYCSTNGGTTWVRQNGIVENDVTFSLSGAKIQTFGDNKIAVAQENFVSNVTTFNKLFLSNDGGASWVVHKYQNPGAPDHDFSIHATHFFDTDKFILGGNNGLLYLNHLYDGSEIVTSVSENRFPNEIDQIFIFPNPTNNLINIRLDKSMSHENTTFRLMNGVGQVVQSVPLQAGTTSMAIDNTPEGIYFYRIERNNKTIKAGKLVVAQ